MGARDAKGAAPGASGELTTFSFYPTKVMTAGEGGMITTNDDRLAEEARIYRDQGKASFTVNAHTRLGYNWRMSEPNAIIGRRHLERLPDMIADRQRIAGLYDAALKDFSGLTPLRTPPGGECNYYKYVVSLARPPDRNALKAGLREKYGVSLTGEVYEDPIHRQPIFERYADTDLSVSERVCANPVCLPVFSGMTEGQAHQVIDALSRTIG